jgi:putative Mn2+ efflux pump MntP
MAFWELVLIAVGLSMDAFAVSICKGLAVKKVTLKEMLIAGAWFGGFQGLMPLTGWFLGSRFRVYIESIDHWIAFALLVLIGLNMLREALFSKEEEKVDDSFGFKTMLLMAIATSIDALAVGITFGLLLDGFIPTLMSCLFICLVTFIFSAAGVKVGALAGERFEKKAEVAGGIILILIGIKILLSHLGIIGF